MDASLVVLSGDELGIEEPLFCGIEATLADAEVFAIVHDAFGTVVDEMPVGLARILRWRYGIGHERLPDEEIAIRLDLSLDEYFDRLADAYSFAVDLLIDGSL